MNNKIFNEIDGELGYQDAKWGAEFDEKNTQNDWVSYITSYAGRAIGFDAPPEQFRKDMIKVAALAIAAIETHDSLKGKMAKRHYDEGYYD